MIVSNNIAKKPRKYFDGLIQFDIKGNPSYSRWDINISQDEFVSYNGSTNLIVKRDGVVYDLSEYMFERVDFPPPNSKKERFFVNGVYVYGDVYLSIIGGLFKKNFKFKDSFIYSHRCSRGHHFKSSLNGKNHYVCGKDFDKYFVPNMVNGKIDGTFTYAKHGASYWVTLVTD